MKEEIGGRSSRLVFQKIEKDKKLKRKINKIKKEINLSVMKNGSSSGVTPIRPTDKHL